MNKYQQTINTCKIIDYLQHHKVTTSQELADYLSLSQREVFRYVKVMKSEKIIVTYRGRYGGIALTGKLYTLIRVKFPK